jgi:hypothetical protein
MSHQAFDDFHEMVKMLMQKDLVSKNEISGQGQCGFADMNPTGFYFLLKDRDAIALHLEGIGYKKAFLETVAYKCYMKDNVVNFWRAGHIRGSAPGSTIELSQVTPAF